MISLLVLLAQTIGLNAQADAHFVKLDRNGWATIEAAPPESLGSFEHLWIWSEQCAPVRVESHTGIPPCAPTKRVVVRALRGGHPIAGAVLAWGTRTLVDEVPDELLPRALTADDGTAALQLPAAEPVFARIVGPRDTSQWRTLEFRGDRAELAAVSAVDVTIRPVNERQQTATHVRVLLSSPDATTDDPPIFTTVEQGILRLRLPAAGTSRAILWGDETAPVETAETNARLSGLVVLPRGCALRGTVIGRDGKAIEGAGVSVVFPLGNSGRGTRRRTISGNQGHFEMRGIACGVSVLSVGKKPFAPLRRELTIPEATLDLGRLVLHPSRTVRVAVRDTRDGHLLAGASARVLGVPIAANTNPEGTAILDGVATDDVDIEVSATGYLPATSHVEAGNKKPLTVHLTRGATIVARVVRGDDHRPVGPGTLWIDFSGTKRIERFGTDGRVRITGLRSGTLSMEVRVPGLASHQLPRRDVVEGGDVDFGTIVLDAGSAISGTVVDATTSAPLQARVRAPRPNPLGPRLSLVMKDWIETSSDENGQFQMSGLNAGDYRLLVEAPGFAPALTERVMVGADGPDAEGGVVRLARARRLSIACRPAKRCGSKAQMLLGDPNDDWAFLTAPINNGRGEILDAPPGRHQLQLLDRGAVVATKDVVIPDDAMETTAEIALREIDVRGDVLRGGRPVTSGTVQFIANTPQSAMPIVVDHKLDSAVVGSDIVGVVSRTVVVNVDDRGTFVTQDLAPGSYSVSYSGVSGISREHEVIVPDADRYALHIDIPATNVTGLVVDEKGNIPEWARVELQVGTRLFSADMMPDGRFSIDGALAGTANLHAFNDTAEADRQIVIEADRETEIDLTLHAKPRKRITLTALDASGAPRRLARLFLLCDGALTSADADANGAATFPVSVSANSCLAAAFSAVDGWAFQGPIPIPKDSDPAESSIRFAPRTAALAIETQAASTFTISATNGFPLERTFAFIGWPSMVVPPQPLRLRGLPPGNYMIRLDTGLARTIVVDGTKDIAIKF